MDVDIQAARNKLPARGLITPDNQVASLETVQRERNGAIGTTDSFQWHPGI